MAHIAFRTDASEILGIGHFVRCLTLANELKERGHHISFFSYQLSQFFKDMLNKSGHDNISLSTLFEITPLSQKSIDFLLIDHYMLDKSWEIQVRTPKFVIDDLRREHQCDIILDQNLYNETPSEYKDAQIQLMGPKYALLRPVFHELRSILESRIFNFPEILIFYGGSDPSNETYKALLAISNLSRPFNAHLLIGPLHQDKSRLLEYAAKIPQLKIYNDFQQLPGLMAKCNVSLGAGGMTTWERCCLGLPTIVTTVAENQIDLSHKCAERRLIILAGTNEAVNAEQLLKTLKQTLINPELLKDVSNNGMKALDGLGTKRVANSIESFLS